MQTRREFLMTSAMCAIAVASVEERQSCLFAPEYSAPLMYAGDPYTAHADEGGLGGRSFDAARDHALRFRSADHDRDRLVLGLEV